MIRKVWKDKGFDGELNPAMVKHYAEELWTAAKEGYGENWSTIDPESADGLLMKKLQQDVWHFSAAKNYSELRALSDALTAPDGNLRSFKEFAIEAANITGEFHGPWLKTEYEFAVASSQMSVKWNQFNQFKDLLPNLKYVTVNDERVREEHRMLEGIVRPIDDGFWKVYYPPNGWNCRCNVAQGDWEVTPWEQVVLPDIPPMFRTNFATEGLLFPPGHPYYVDAPPEVMEKAKQLFKKYGQ